MSQIHEVFESYQNAAAVCGAGYNDRILTDMVVAKTKIMSLNPLGVPLTSDPTAILTTAIAAIAASGSSPIRVLDFGGAAGHHYFYSKALLPQINLKWSVVETSAMVESASSEFQNEELTFFETINSALNNLGECDFVFSSGAIQYHPSPEEVFDELVGIGARDLMIARLPLFDGPRTVGVQTSKLSENGPGPLPQGFNDRIIKYPVTFCTRTQITEKLLGSYRLNAQFQSPSANYLIGGRPAIGATLLLRRRA